MAMGDRKVGRAVVCVCDGWTPQNAVHLLGCPWIGYGKRCTSEQVWEDERWCEAVAGFLMPISLGGGRDWPE